MKRKNIAVTDIVGTLLLLGIAITIFTLLYVSFMTITPSPIKPSVNFIGTVENNNITIEHRGGKIIDLDTEIIVTINGTDDRFIVNDYIDNEAKKDGVWDIGERVVYPTVDITDLVVSISVVDPHSNSVIMMATLQE